MHIKTYNFLDKRKLLRQNNSEVKKSLGLSNKAICCYSRYMLRKYSLQKYNHNTMPLCPSFEKYTQYNIAIFIRAFQIKKTNDKFLTSYTVMRWPDSGCYEINLIAKKYIKKHMNLRVKFFLSFRNKSFNLFKVNTVNKVSIIDHIRFYFFAYKRRIRNFNKVNKENSIFIKDKDNLSVLIHSHPKKGYTNPYFHLEENLNEYYEDKKETLISLNLDQIGVEPAQRISSAFLSLKLILKSLKKYRFFRLSDVYFIFFVKITNKYIKNLKEYLKRNQVKLVISSYICSERLDRLYKSCRDLSIKFALYDYSIGPPLENDLNIRYVPDTRKYADLIFASCEFRKRQYEAATKHLNSKPIIKLHYCPQTAYSISKAENIKYHPYSQKEKNFKIGLIDNRLITDGYMHMEDVITFIKTIQRIEQKLTLFLQTKSKETFSLFKKYKIKHHIIPNECKGDFSAIKRVDLIISLNFQGTAIKAASAFKKPLIFYTEESYNYGELIFLSDKKDNHICNQLIKKLWFDRESIYNLLNNILIPQKINYINKKSSELISLIGMAENKNIKKIFEENF